MFNTGRINGPRLRGHAEIWWAAVGVPASAGKQNGRLESRLQPEKDDDSAANGRLKAGLQHLRGTS
jgi:hypothetical protein